MRLLIDECIDERVRLLFPGHDCQTARFAGFTGLTNGQLLDAAEAAGFEVLITVDQGIPEQQNMVDRRISVFDSPRAHKPPSRPGGDRTRGPFRATGDSARSGCANSVRLNCEGPGVGRGRDARRRPHRSVRAGLPHTAPTLDAWRQNERMDKDAGCGLQVCTPGSVASASPLHLRDLAAPG